MREIVLGTAGHVDHGKTSLVKALTGIDTDRLKEEKARGITIELGFAYLDLPCGHRLGIIDVPGHEKFVRNMVAGAAGIDLVAFVVAADEGIMPQTREHFEICRLLGVSRGLIILTKIDLVEPEWLELVTDEVRQYFKDTFLAEAPLVGVSALTGAGIDQVKTELNRLVVASDFAEAFGPFRLPVDRIFTIKGFGAVVTGTSISGRLSVGEEVRIYPAGESGRVRGIQVHAADVELVEAGNRTAINIQGVDKELIQRGNVVATPGSLAPSYIMDAEFIYLSSANRKLKNRSRVRLHLGTAEVMGRVVLLDDEELLPGVTANVQLLFEEPVCAWPGDHYVVRSYSPVHTIGGGRIFNSLASKKRRGRKSNGEIFQCYRQGNGEELALLHVRDAGVTGLTVDELAVRLGIFGKRLRKIIDPPISARKLVVLDPERQRFIEGTVYHDLQERCLALLAEYHRANPLKNGMSREELRSRLRGGDDARLFAFLLAELGRKGSIAQDEAEVRLGGHKVAMGADTGKLREEMLAFYAGAGLTVPTVKEVLERFGKGRPGLVKELMEVLVREGLIIKISEDLYFHATALAELKENIVGHIRAHGGIDAQGFKGLTGLSRKFSIPLLEYFDKCKVTLRIGDTRVLRERQG
ncbi:MAG: selenocysteine-specific translation elongation factor [Desulfobulbaceae bacterium]|nr:selenocysteine-specific translation elongation factor [Desulfobulbaceae bacterium]